jgi:Spy/CpxP family protein refolding chaperone
MRSASLSVALSALSLLAVPVQAQPGLGGTPGRGAEFFLARTGELRLTDQQVVRLAAIARRSADRRRSMRASMDSLGARRRFRGDTADRAARTREMAQMRARFERDRDAARADMRDALAVLTPEQRTQLEQRRQQFEQRRAERKAQRQAQTQQQ